MDKISKLTGTVALGTAALAAMPTEANAAPTLEVEDNGVFATPQNVPMSVGDDGISGSINAAVNDIDFFHITGLPAGGTAAFRVDGGSHFALEAGIYTNPATPDAFVDFDSNSALLVGAISNSGDLVLGVKERGGTVDSGIEGYSIKLEAVTTVDRVPEPATLVLLGAGLAGLHVARRRKRG